MNILFVLYHDFSTSSAIHVHNLANCLSERGHQVAVTVPKNKESNRLYMSGPIAYSSYDFEDSLNDGIFLNEKKGIDIIHAWTPREKVRMQCVKLLQDFPASKLIVHLEDNEEMLAEYYTGMPFRKLERIPQERLSSFLSDFLSFPWRYSDLLARADGVTVIVDELLEFIPKDKKHLRLWPVIDLERFSPDISGDNIRSKYNIRDDEFVLCYVGSVQSVNADEVRSLYLAIALANRQGIPTRLLRAGRDVVDLMGNAKRDVEEFIIELGFVEADQVPALMGAADILVQPGRIDRFNRYRLPSKIPEFLATGKPVALPNANIGQYLKDSHNALIMETGDAQSIYQMIDKVYKDRKLAEKIGKRGRTFAEKFFSAKIIADQLTNFYKDICS